MALCCLLRFPSNNPKLEGWSCPRAGLGQAWPRALAARWTGVAGTALRLAQPSSLCAPVCVRSTGMPASCGGEPGQLGLLSCTPSCQRHWPPAGHRSRATQGSFDALGLLCICPVFTPPLVHRVPEPPSPRERRLAAGETLACAYAVAGGGTGAPRALRPTEEGT